MHSTLTALIDRLDNPRIAEADVIAWGSPVPSFGDLSVAKVATLGLNPSRREFVDASGTELSGPLRRFHTLNSLGLVSWPEADCRHLQAILDSCKHYFARNPYRGWFAKLEQVISGTSASYFDPTSPACHLDLVPYATGRKWAELSLQQRSSLISATADTLGALMRDSPLQLLILNGKSVVDLFQQVASVKLSKNPVEDWSLSRHSGHPVAGYAFRGSARSIGGIDLGREMAVVGFNHNLQSSYGVTAEVTSSIRSWVSRAAAETLQ